MSKSENVIFNFKVPSELLKRAHAYCRKRNTTLSALLREFLEERTGMRRPRLLEEIEGFLQIQSLLLGMEFMILQRLTLLYQSSAALLKAAGQGEDAQKMLEEAESLQRDLKTLHSLGKGLLEEYEAPSALFETLAKRKEGA